MHHDDASAFVYVSLILSMLIIAALLHAAWPVIG